MLLSSNKTETASNTKMIKNVNWGNIIAAVLLFILALFVRLSYQSEAVVDKPIRADAKQYVLTAYNLYHFETYSSSSPPSDGSPPKPDFRRPPGYPLFLYPFIATSRTIPDFVDNVTMAQAIIGALTVVMAFALGKMCFNLSWAVLLSLFAAMSPHLVAVDHYLLTESLFTFNLLTASLLLVCSWKFKRRFLSLAAGASFGFLILVRPVAILLGPLMGIIYLINTDNWSIAHKKIIAMQLISFMIGYAAVYTPYLMARNAHADTFSVSGQTIWDKVVIGADINLEHFLINKIDPVRRAETKRMNEDKKYAVGVLKEKFFSQPLAYAKWYLGGKIFFLWKWDNIYNGDVYQYPMVKKGFHTNKILKAIHTVMHWSHWPLFLLTLTAILIFFVECLRNTLDLKKLPIIVPLLMFCYFALLFSVLGPLPRYGIPIRPFSYILSVYGLVKIISFLKHSSGKRQQRVVQHA